MDDERLARVLKRVWDTAREKGFVKPDPDDPSKEIIHADRNWLLGELKKANQLER